MTDQIQETPQATLPRNRWQRFVDWLAGGPPDPQKIEAAQKKYPTWYRRYSLSLVGITLTYMQMIHPVIISSLNAAPELDRLQTLQVRIVQTREGDPHFDMQLPDGTVQAMEWPVNVTFSRGNRVYYWDKHQRQSLVGCHATAQVAQMRWTLKDRYRVWGLSCPAVNFEVSVEQTFNHLKGFEFSSAMFNFGGVLTLFFPFLVIVFLREKRGVL